MAGSQHNASGISIPVSSPNDKVVPKSSPCIIRRVAKRPSGQDNCQTTVRKSDNCDDTLSDSKLLSLVEDSK